MFHFVNEKIIVVQFIETRRQLVDILTKAPSKNAHLFFKENTFSAVLKLENGGALGDTVERLVSTEKECDTDTLTNQGEE